MDSIEDLLVRYGWGWKALGDCKRPVTKSLNVKITHYRMGNIFTASQIILLCQFLLKFGNLFFI